jgi:hypothetical protein
MDFINNWSLRPDGKVVGTLLNSEWNPICTYVTEKAIDITPLPNKIALLETEHYYCELGNPIDNPTISIKMKQLDKLVKTLNDLQMNGGEQHETY